jgi:DNA mismatch repair protein MutL
MKDVLERTAMMRWNIGFVYEHDGKRTLDCPSADDWSERIRQIWGDALRQDLFPVRHETGDLVIEGYLSHPNRHRNTAGGLWVYVNGRAIFDRGLLHAVMHSYGPLMERGRYPAGVLQVTLPSNDVDVNVHPTKREVRFRDPRRVFDGVLSAVKRLLREQPWISHLKEVRTELQASTPGSAEGVSEPIVPFEGQRVRKPKGKSYQEPGLFNDETEPPMDEMQYLGSVEDTYLVFSTADGLQIIDQHAAHERILFERLKAQWREDGKNQSQGLLWAEVVELPSDRHATLERLLAPLASLGWLVEPFGGNAWRMKTVPPWINPGEASNVLLDLLEECAEIGLEGREEDFLHRMLAQLACRTSVKGRSRVVEREALELAKRLRQTPEMGLCPHGRPTIVEIPLAELRRRFKRN